jgi:hypothetical protein
MHLSWGKLRRFCTILPLETCTLEVNHGISFV